MNFLLDNNLSPALARALDELSKAEWDGSHTVTCLRDKFPANTPDAEWIVALSGEGGWAVITHDRFNKGQEREVLRRAGLIVFMLNKSWSSQRFWNKANQLVRWWPRIVEQAEGVRGGAAFSVSWKFSGKGKFEQIVF